MLIDKTSRTGAIRESDQHIAHALGWLLPTALMLGAVLMLSALLPMPLVLPAVSALMVVAGFATAAALYLSGRRIEREPSGGWLVAGALVFLGFAAALISDSDQVLALLEQMQTTGLAAATR